jgi:hypothetical protein
MIGITSGGLFLWRSRCSALSPDGNGGDPATLLLLARRQASALAVGRRQQLARLGSRLGLEISSLPYEPVPGRLQRPYELIG